MERLRKHEAICQKTTQKKRKVFDITKQRIQGTEAEAFARKPMLRNTNRTITTKTPSISLQRNDWRRKHEEFISAIKAAKDMQTHLARGGKLSDLPPPPPSENPDYVQCPHCNRRFNEQAASRHIPKCANYLHNKPRPVPPKKKL